MKKIILSLALILTPFLFSEPAQAYKAFTDANCKKIFRNETCVIGCNTNHDNCSQSSDCRLASLAPDRRCVMRITNGAFDPYDDDVCYCLELPPVRECPGGMEKSDDDEWCVPDGTSQQETIQLDGNNMDGRGSER